MFDDLSFPYITSLPFQMISSNLLLRLTHLKYLLPYTSLTVICLQGRISKSSVSNWFTVVQFCITLQHNKNSFIKFCRKLYVIWSIKCKRDIIGKRKCGFRRGKNRVCTKLLNFQKWDRVGTVAYRGIFLGGLNKFSWGQRADRTGIWGRYPSSQMFLQFSHEWNRILIRFLRMYNLSNWEFGSALSKLRNFCIGRLGGPLVWSGQVVT
jgi:hypothetical protein